MNLYLFVKYFPPIQNIAEQVVLKHESKVEKEAYEEAQEKEEEDEVQVKINPGS